MRVQLGAGPERPPLVLRAGSAAERRAWAEAFGSVAARGSMSA